MSKLDVVLTEVNIARRALGLRPLGALPKGRRKDFRYCPIGRALQRHVGPAICRAESEKRAMTLAAHWGTDWHTPDGEVYVVKLPPELRSFIQAFDDGEYPELRGRNVEFDPEPEDVEE